MTTINEVTNIINKHSNDSTFITFIEKLIQLNKDYSKIFIKTDTQQLLNFINQSYNEDTYNIITNEINTIKKNDNLKKLDTLKKILLKNNKKDIWDGMSDLKREIIIQNLSEYNYVTISSPDGFYNEWGRSNFECKFFDISVIISCDGTQYYLYIDNYEVACSYRYRELLHAFYGNEHINKLKFAMKNMM